MEMELYKEVAAEIRVVVHGHCSKAHATLGRQVGHTRCLAVAVVVNNEAGREQKLQGVPGKDVIAVGCHRGEAGGHTQA